MEQRDPVLARPLRDVPEAETLSSPGSTRERRSGTRNGEERRALRGDKLTRTDFFAGWVSAVSARLSGKRAIVTGGAGGMGRSHALRLARLGADVAIFDIDLAVASKWNEQLHGRLGR